jgi:hypothetical protein
MFYRIRNTLLTFLILIYILFEELIWERAVVPVVGFISRFHLYCSFLEYIELRAGRFTVLILFIVPFVVGEIIGIMSGILAARLYLLSAVLLYMCKIPLIVVALAILQRGKKKLLTFDWFALCYGWVITQLEKLHQSQLYQQIHLMMAGLRRQFSSRSSQTARRIVRLYQHIRYRFIK